MVLGQTNFELKNRSPAIVTPGVSQVVAGAFLQVLGYSWASVLSVLFCWESLSP